jgi:AraC family transcriptional regulator
MTTATDRYLARMQRVLDHIDTHLDEDLDVDGLAGVAAFSRFHFHRQFSAGLGLSVHRYIQLSRLKRAAFQLAFRETAPVTTVAFDAGYESPEAFARAFQKRLGQTPSAFRASPAWQPWLLAVQPLTDARSIKMPDFNPADVSIVDFPTTPLLVMTHHGDPAQVGATIRRFIAWRRAHRLPPARYATFNLFHTDPLTTRAEDCRMDIGVATDRAIDLAESGVMATTIPAGRCARLRLVGSSDNLEPAATWLYGRWLPTSGEELRDFPFFCQRVSYFPDVAEHSAVTDLFVPLV